MSSSIPEILTNTKQRVPIANRKKVLKPIANRRTPQTNVIVDKLLETYSDLIDPSYKKWFAKRFYDLPFDRIHSCASEARHDGSNPQRLFVFLINKLFHSQLSSPDIFP